VPRRHRRTVARGFHGVSRRRVVYARGESVVAPLLLKRGATRASLGERGAVSTGGRTNMSMKILLAAAFATSAALAAPTAGAALYWTDWVSEEGGSPMRTCGAWNEAAIGFGCSGRYCDNVRLLCQTMPFGTTLDPSTDYWTAWFSEETYGGTSTRTGYFYNEFDENYQICQYPSTIRGYAGLMSGIRCRGDNCDDISLECTWPVKFRGVVKITLNTTNCQWSTNSYSEEQGSVDFGDNRFIVGVECFGSHCDNKKFYVCSLVDPG
jgi:hypothetical protein